MHGWNNGLSGLLELCNDPTICIIGVQEHWLHGDNVNLLNNVHPEFVGFGLSSMNSRLSSEIYRGRPFGGVGFLWRKSISNNVQITSRADSGRSLCISLECPNHHIINVVNVYFPCYTSSVEYTSQLADSLSFIEDVLSLGFDTIILGDMNLSVEPVILATENAMHCCLSLMYFTVMTILVVVPLLTAMSLWAILPLLIMYLFPVHLDHMLLMRLFWNQAVT